MYEEAAPPAQLRSVARCVWRSASEGPKRIVPDGCVDLVAGDGEVFVAGPDTSAWSSVTRPGATLSGVRFIPGRAAAVLGVAADELRDRRVPLGELWGRAGEVVAERLLEGELSPAQAVASRVGEVPVADSAVADSAVAELIARLDAGVARVAEAAAMLTQPDSGSTNIAGTALTRTGLDAASVGVGERRLRRRFVQAVGYGPATYLRVSRFQRAVALAPRVAGLAALAAAAGYADQAHLSRDCRALTGLTPRGYFRGTSTVDVAVRDRLRSA
ncbi:helix-turn-helix domain-containing protein [Amycolatopsis sp. A133]|uniref:helix-turn-helix domain-containing protein n=1 Tax=Amycolatopsis sp. A133 TaxID=3064472 RepID=UPI0027EA4726|nr:helix-turn-helix domain-containing protein [Amycolatopsis sp. A133]MDQ7805642.1 helix-turn-helix domain-containing protein [Amycolatopsis sp. A133]